MNYIIRPMEIKDIVQVAAIEKDIFSVPWSANSFIEASQNENNIYLVCAQNDEVTGYCGLWTVLGEGDVTNVAVSKNHRGKGYGRALLKVRHMFTWHKWNDAIARKMAYCNDD